MKQKIYVKKDNKPIFKIVIDNSKIDIYEKICGIYKYRRINYSITNYNNIYLGYSPCKLKKYKNSFDIIETIDYRYSYEYNNKSIESILIEMSNNPYTYISIFQNVFMFKLDEPVIKYNLLHNICHHKLFSNKYIISSIPILKTINYTFNLYDFNYLKNEEINYDLHEYIFIHGYPVDIIDKFLKEKNIKIQEYTMNKESINELFTETIENELYDDNYYDHLNTIFNK